MFKINVLLLFTIYLIKYTNAYFYVPTFMSNLPFQDGMAFAQRNNSLILFGGENATNTYTNNLYELSQLSDTFSWKTLNQTNTPPGTIYGQSIIHQNTMHLFGGMTNSTTNQLIPLQHYQYSFQNQSWTSSSTNAQNVSLNATTVPLNRKLFSATFDGNSKIYFYGGALNESAIFSDFWSYDLNTNQYTQLPNIQLPRYAHSASYLSNGKIVFLGGVAQVNQSGQIANILAPMNQVYIYDTKTNQWDLKEVSAQNNIMPSTRTAHNAVVTSDDKIIIFGGDNGAIQRQRAYLNAVAVLDTNTWTWSIPTVGGIPPSRRSYAAAGILSGNYLTVAFGSSNNAYYNDINVLNLDSYQWLQTFNDSHDNSSSGLSGGVIAGVTIACVALAGIILFLLWRFQHYVRWFITRIHHDIWKPRTGEPLWAETTRIIFQIILLFIFSVFLVFVIKQAIDSPNVTQTIEQSAAEVQVPDVRFCFDGYPNYPENDVRTLGISCQTDNGYSCTQFIQKLDMSVFQPTFSDNLGAVNCYLFRSPESFVVTSTSGANNGSRLLFTFYGDQTAYGRIHTSVYPKQMDPNTLVYGINDSIPTLMTEAQMLTWQIAERNDLQATNVYTIEPFTYSALAYDLIDHRYLQSVGWNYVGFLPITNSTPEIESYFRQEAPNPTYTSTHADLGIIAVFPNAYVTTIQREVKMYTLVNALGFVGGIFGLLVAVQTWLFGYRPRSPWGVVHRWSVGNMKRSLLNGLQSKFKITESGIPLVHPVHHRFSVTNLNDLEYYEDSEQQRINRVEERMQMLEMLFKAYYVDDEVFRSLDDANRKGTTSGERQLPSRLMSSTSSTTFTGTAPRTEKVDSYHPVGKSSPSQADRHPFVRYDTDASATSQIPLRAQHPPSYQPSTTVQMNDL